MSNKRDYNNEFHNTADHQYVYNFDFDIMHRYFMRAMSPFFVNRENCLELGSFKGDFTKRLLANFKKVTCIEASGDAIKIAQEKLNNEAIIHHSTFEEAQLAQKFDTVIMTHVLEHISDPVSVLKKIREEWLSDNGYFFVICPNANAPSRQIAVKMGLITHNAAVTPSEKEHGHHITYSLDTLERDATQAGLKVVFRTGIFFKALANFQWDKILKTDIISEEYLEGCFQLGQVYPDLCSSILLVCKK